MHKKVADDAQRRQNYYLDKAQRSGLAVGIKGIGTPEQQEIAARERANILMQEKDQNDKKIIANNIYKFRQIMGFDLGNGNNVQLTEAQAERLRGFGWKLKLDDSNEETAIGALSQSNSFLGGISAFWAHVFGYRDPNRTRGYLLNLENFDEEGEGVERAVQMKVALGSPIETTRRYVQGLLTNRENAISRGEKAIRISLAGEDQVLSQQEMFALTPQTINKEAIRQGFLGARMMGYDQNLGVFIIRVETGFGETSDFQIPVVRNVNPA
jgi:hypothetical protein